MPQGNPTRFDSFVKWHDAQMTAVRTWRDYCQCVDDGRGDLAQRAYYIHHTMAVARARKASELWQKL